MCHQRRPVIRRQHRPEFDQPVQVGINQRVPCANCAGICATFNTKPVFPMTFAWRRIQYRPSNRSRKPLVLLVFPTGQGVLHLPRCTVAGLC